jgi:DNA-binding MarR family transcriptional regulator
MQALRATGRNAGAVKYDILTALLALGQHDGGAGGRLATRLALLITARFNWQSGTMAVGQREIARLWNVTERTAKREMAAMRARGWVTVRHPSARGRVTVHALDLDRMLSDTAHVWSAVGPDFQARMSPEPKPRPDTNVVPFGRAGGVPTADGTLWAAASARLWRDDPAVHAAWFARLVEADRAGDSLTLAAPSAFMASYVAANLGERLLAAVLAEDPGIRAVKVVPR